MILVSSGVAFPRRDWFWFGFLGAHSMSRWFRREMEQLLNASRVLSLGYLFLLDRSLFSGWFTCHGSLCCLSFSPWWHSTWRCIWLLFHIVRRSCWGWLGDFW